MAKSPYSKKVLEVAALLDVPKSTVENIRKIKKERPDLLEKIQEGQLSIDGAMRVISASKDVIIFPLHDMKEATRLIMEAHNHGKIGWFNILELIDLLAIEIKDYAPM
jgi:hypothetical protein